MRCLLVMVKLRGRSVRRGEASGLYNVSMVLDRSGSMQGDKLEQCKHAARYALSHVTDRDFASIVTFGATAEVW